MPKSLLVLVVLFLFSCSKDAEIPDLDVQEDTSFLGEIEWIKNFGGSGEDTAQSIIATSDGGFAVFGFTNSIDGDVSDKTMPVVDYWLLKLDIEGNLQWSKTYGGSGEDKGQQVYKPVMADMP